MDLNHVFATRSDKKEICDLLGEISDRRCTQVRVGKEGQAQKRATT